MLEIFNTLVQNPYVQGAAGAAILMLLKKVFGLALTTYKPVKDAATATASLNAFLLKNVKLAESLGILKGWAGAEKADYVMTEVDKYLREQGIVGDANVVTLNWARAQMELLRADLYPNGK